MSGIEISGYRDVPIFSAMSEDRLRRLETYAHVRTYAARESVFESDDGSDDVYVIIRGNAHVLSFGVNGRFVSFACLGAGDLFGELAAIDGLSRSASVVATKELKVSVISGPRFIEAVSQESDAAVHLFGRLAHVIRENNRRVVDLSMLDVTQRVCLKLLSISHPDPDQSRQLLVHPVPTQADLASDIGSSRETVARIMGRLRTDGIYTRKGRTLVIQDRKRFERLAV